MDAEKRTAELAQARAAVEGHPVVQEAVRLFGAQLRDVRLPTASSELEESAMQFRGGMNELMRQAARMQRKIEQAKTELKDRELTVEGLGGKVKVTVTLGREHQAHRDRQETLKTEEGRARPRRRVRRASTRRIEQADKQMEAELDKVTGGVKIPGMV